MDQSVRNWMKKRISIGICELSGAELLFLATLTLLAVSARLMARSFVAQDWTDYWEVWLSHLQKDGFVALAEDFYDYTPPILYLLYLFTLLPINAMTAFKGFCCILEFLGAAMIALLVFDCTKSREKALLSYGIFLFLPTVALNSAVWCQCDIIYTLPTLCSVYFLLKNKKWAAMWLYGAAFAIKLQTLFIFPVFVILWVKKKIDFKHFITLPVMYFVGIFPAWIAGRPFGELLRIYVLQGGKDRWSLSMKFPNIYQIIGESFFRDEYTQAGVCLTLGILMLAMFYMAYQEAPVTKKYVLLMIVFYGMLATYFLPHMHERYLYLTDAFLLVYVMVHVRRFWLFPMAGFLSVVGYAQYLTKNDPLVPYGLLAFLQLLALIQIGLDLYHCPKSPQDAFLAAWKKERGLCDG